ncbi:pathogenesis-related thaumatin-like protein 3.5 [Vicia villosa]|uniref:pathogenesis-related thaumatin-like protein 3.5 n=1 Tax=Vicia villosa TaxID=3911 RepID=UPI00273BFDD3|nr:pathogenesis-related thaumatin-like protein 3.5 [Vicia villosa]
MALKHLSLIFMLFYSLGVDATIFTLQNKCRNTMWPGILTAAGKPQLIDGGVKLKPGQAINVTAPRGWSGRVWGRRGCTFNSFGIGKCITGDCGGKLRCAGAGGVPPASLAEFTLDSPVGDFYDVSLVDGYNFPISIIPLGGSGMCKAVKCISDLNRNCPAGLELRNIKGRVVGCKSACMAFHKPEFCCTGVFNSPKMCAPSIYSKVFKASCPMAYSYAYDDATSTFTCYGADYLIRFC